ncbi:hypothetical protein ID866_5525 [Astraeus odoratus]|nr:hypothetical protein ID866_5525 [Astraeus odoratus]
MDFSVTPIQPVTLEFLAVVLAGFGNELTPLTGDLGSEPVPKALLPIANKPMIDYVLSWVEQSGIQARIKGDFVLLPCDFVPPPSLPLSRLLDKFRTEVMADGAIVTTCWFEMSLEKTAAPEEWRMSSRSTAIAWDDSTGALLYVDNPDDTDRNPDELEIRMSLLSRYPRIKFSSKLQDSHVYVCKRGILDLLQQKTELDSFREDFLPWLCKLQYQKVRYMKYGDTFGSTAHSPFQPPSEEKENQPMAKMLRVGLVIHRANEGGCFRTNNLPAYLEANRHFIGDVPYILPSDPQRRSLIDAKALISSDSMVGDFTRVDERATIKRSIIGKHCIISKTVKIVGCILLDHCVIAEGAKLEGSILGKNTTVGRMAELVRCVTQGGYEVKENESYQNEKLDVSEWGAQSDGLDEAVSHGSAEE